MSLSINDRHIGRYSHKALQNCSANFISLAKYSFGFLAVSVIVFIALKVLMKASITQTQPLNPSRISPPEKQPNKQKKAYQRCEMDLADPKEKAINDPMLDNASKLSLHALNLPKHRPLSLYQIIDKAAKRLIQTGIPNIHLPDIQSWEQVIASEGLQGKCIDTICKSILNRKVKSIDRLSAQMRHVVLSLCIERRANQILAQTFPKRIVDAFEGKLPYVPVIQITQECFDPYSRGGQPNFVPQNIGKSSVARWIIKSYEAWYCDRPGLVFYHAGSFNHRLRDQGDLFFRKFVNSHTWSQGQQRSWILQSMSTDHADHANISSLFHAYCEKRDLSKASVYYIDDITDINDKTTHFALKKITHLVNGTCPSENENFEMTQDFRLILPSPKRQDETPTVRLERFSTALKSAPLNRDGYKMVPFERASW